MSDSALQRNLESLEQKYIHLIGSAQKHISRLEDQASELKLMAISQEAAMNQLQDKCENLTSLHATLREEADWLKSQNNALMKEADCLKSQNNVLIEEADCLKSQNNNQLSDVQEENELLLLQLHQVLEELEHYFLENQRKDEKLHWLRGQRELLLRMLRLQGRFQQRFLALDGRIVLPSLRRQLMPWWLRLQRS